MINTDLNTKRTAKATGSVDYSPVPEGTYHLKVKEIGEWKETIKTIKVIKKDEKGSAILDSKGNKETETIKDCKFYNCNIRFEIVGGEYEGKLVFHSITTHPNMDWSIDNFLYATGVEEASASEIPTLCLGKDCVGNVIIDSYEKTVQNKETGIDETVTREVNRIKSLKPYKEENVVELTDEDLPMF